LRPRFESSYCAGFSSLSSGLSQSNYYYERIVISMCPSLPNRFSYPSNSVVT
jgi:hypothetical protein